MSLVAVKVAYCVNKNRWAYLIWDCLSASPKACEYHKIASTKCILTVPCTKSYVEALLLAVSIDTMGDCL